MTAFWSFFAASFLCLAWVLPNHVVPWISFHSDAWCASVLLIVGLYLVFKSKAGKGWHVLTIGVGFTSLLPWIQFATGHIPIFGVAWINSVYLLGFLFALRTGERWELCHQGQTAGMVFTATLFAAVLSTGIGANQWLGLVDLGPWTLHVQGSPRVYANMAQPNNLGSLLLLGLLGVSWGYYKRWFGIWVAIGLACFILFGVALTQSRTAWLNLALILLGLFIWRRTLPSKKYFLVVVGLLGYFATVALTLPALNQALLESSGFGEVGTEQYRTLADPVRLAAWKLLLTATFQEPILGYGWGQLASANFVMAGSVGIQPGLFLQSHNLFLDFVLMNGYPIGLLLCLVLVWWAIAVVVRIKTFDQMHMVAFVMVLGVHSMLEYPLHYAFFLLPFGLMVGALNSSLNFAVVFKPEKWLEILIATAVASALILTVRDYLNIERSFYALRFESRGIKTDLPNTPPEIAVLTQFREFFKLARNSPVSGLEPDEIQSMIDGVNALPSAHTTYKLAEVLAVNGRAQEARQWLRVLCKFNGEPSCSARRLQWQTNAAPQVANVPWPEEFLK